MTNYYHNWSKALSKYSKRSSGLWSAAAVIGHFLILLFHLLPFLQIFLIILENATIFMQMHTVLL